MPFLAPAIPALIGAGASIAGSLLGGKKQTQQQSSTQTTTPTLSPEMQALMGRLMTYQQGIMDNPSAGLEPIRTNAMEQVNRNYAGAPDRIATSLAKRGFTQSGQMPHEMFQLEGSRLNDQSGLQAKFAQMISDRQMQGASLGERLLAGQTGHTTTGTGTGSVSAPGGLGAGLTSGAGALGSVAQLLAVMRGMKQGGNISTGAPGGGGWGSPGDFGGDAGFGEGVYE